MLVGHTTLISGDGPLQVGRGPVRTGVTVVLPRGFSSAPVFAGYYALNGNGEMTGTIWVEESGLLEGPIGLTNTHSVGVVRDAIIAWQVRRSVAGSGVVRPGIQWSLPVVAETYDGGLNDINGQHVKPEHVFTALDQAAGGPVDEGSVGGGTGMRCFGYKGGIGTASRSLDLDQGSYVLGALVQANFGRAAALTIAGVPVGNEMPGPGLTDETDAPPGAGSLIVVVATDAPLLPHQLKRLARRVPLGLARIGGAGEHGSGDIFIAFSTANPNAGEQHAVQTLEMLPSDAMTPLFDATVQATEEAVLNALVAARTMTGIDGNTAHALPHDRLREVLRKYGRLRPVDTG